MTLQQIHVDVLCVGNASYDLIFIVPHHPEADEKSFASAFFRGGGGPASNAAVAVARLGHSSAFAGYLGTDDFGEAHYQELLQEGVNTDLVVRGKYPTPLSTVLVKPDGRRSVVNYREKSPYLPAGSIDFSQFLPKIILCDGHEPHVSDQLVDRARKNGIRIILDAGSLHSGTRELMNRVDYLICSEKFASQATGLGQAEEAIEDLGRAAPVVIITRGEKGLIWKAGETTGASPGFNVQAKDTTGAGDTFHGAFAACLAAGLSWREAVNYSSAAAALSCTKVGARAGIPTKKEIEDFLKRARP